MRGCLRMKIDMNMKRSSRRSLTAFALKGLIIGDDNLQKADSTDLKSRHEAAQIAKEAKAIGKRINVALIDCEGMSCFSYIHWCALVNNRKIIMNTTRSTHCFSLSNSVI